MKSKQYTSETGHDSKAIANNIKAKKGANVSFRRIPIIQTKLTIGSPGDEYEQEADKVADSVMRMSETQIRRQEEEEEMIQPKSPDIISRQEEEEEVIQPKSSGDIISKQEEEEEMLQAKERSSEGQNADVPATIAHQINQSKGGGSSMPDTLRASMEGRFNADFSSVNIHNNTTANQLSRQVNAQAFTHGSDIYFGAGKYDPGSSGGQNLIAHELTHVVQQRPHLVSRKKDSVKPKISRIHRRAANTVSGVLQRTTTSDFYGEAWNAYIYPGKAKPIYIDPLDKTKGRDKKAEEANETRGEKVRAFQKYDKRKVKTEGNKKIIMIGSADFDKKEKTIGFKDKETSMEDKSTDMSQPAEWQVSLDRHVLFDGNPSPDDLAQRALGDCYLLAVLQSLARTAGGKSKLRNIVKPSGDNYSVEFFRLKYAGGQVTPDPGARIRVSVTKSRNYAASTFRSLPPKNLTPEEIAEIRTSNSDTIEPIDKVYGTSQKHITWPWAIEKAYASVVGSYSKIAGGYAGMPIMVLMGQMADYYWDIHKSSDIAIKNLFSGITADLSKGRTITAQTLDETTLKTNKYSNDIFISNANDAGIRIYNSVDPTLSGRLSWAWFDKYVDTVTILDLMKAIYGEKGAVVDPKAEKDPKKALIAASRSTWTIIPAKIKDHLMYNTKGKLAAPSHVYSVQDASPTKLTVYNPWGYMHIKDMSHDQFKAVFHHLFFNKP